jgi:enoyl-CoA hydratase/carnithine racemase
MDLTGVAHFHPRFEPSIGLLVLELNHGKANEMGSAELSAFARVCDLVESADSVRCLCTMSRRVSAKGKPVFIAGANVTEREGWDAERVKAHVAFQRQLMTRLRSLPVFNIVVSNGVTLGWGVEYLLTGDYCIATREASFALPETGLGIIPGARGSAELAELIGPAQALRLGMTGETIDATKAHSMGLVQELVTNMQAAMARVSELAAMAAQRSPTANATFKQALLAARGRPEPERLELEHRAYEHTVSTGEAAIGRAHFADVRQGKTPPWGPRSRPSLDPLDR